MRRIFWDGLFKYIYDPWNRLSQVQRAYRDESNDLQATSVISTIQYDGSDRRIVKTVENSGDWNNEYHFFYDGWSKVEERDSSGDVLKQHVWGTQYIDEIVQTCLNDDPADENESVCETKYWGLQDANFNLLAVIGDDGSFAERYEYTPYGQRTVYKESSAGDDPLLTAPILESQRWKVSSVDQAYGICDVGHQGLFFDKEWGAYDNRHRILGPTVARFFQRDPMGYVDGESLCEYARSSPMRLKDPSGRYTSPEPQFDPEGFKMDLQDQVPKAGPYNGSPYYYREEGPPSCGPELTHERMPVMKVHGLVYWNNLVTRFMDFTEEGLEGQQPGHVVPTMPELNTDTEGPGEFGSIVEFACVCRGSKQHRKSKPFGGSGWHFSGHWMNFERYEVTYYTYTPAGR